MFGPRLDPDTPRLVLIKQTKNGLNFFKDPQHISVNRHKIKVSKYTLKNLNRNSMNPLIKFSVIFS